jgi:hypothetical protein
MKVARKSRWLSALVLTGGLALGVAAGNQAVASERHSSPSYKAEVALSFENGVQKDLTIRNRFGNPFSIKTDEGGKTLFLTGVATQTGDGKIDLRFEFRESGIIIGNPHIVTSPGKLAIIRLGKKDSAGAFEGTSAKLKVVLE